MKNLSMTKAAQTNRTETRLQKLLRIKTSEEKRVVLILEDDPITAEVLSASFHRRGFQVFIETKIENARRRLQLLDHTKTRVDLAIVTDSIKDSTTSHFVDLLHVKYKNIKTVVFAESVGEYPAHSEAAVIEKTTNIEFIADAAIESLDYTQEALRKHMKELRESDRIDAVTARLNAGLGHGKPLTKAEKVAYEANRQAIVKRVAKLFLEMMNSPTKLYRKHMLVEFKQHLKLMKYDLSFDKMRDMYKHWALNRGKKIAA